MEFEECFEDHWTIRINHYRANTQKNLGWWPKLIPKLYFLLYWNHR